MKITNVILVVLLMTVKVYAQENQAEPKKTANFNVENTTVAHFSEVRHPEFGKLNSDTSGKKSDEYDSVSAEDLVLFCHPSLFSTELYFTLRFPTATEIHLENENGTVVFKEPSNGFDINKKIQIPEELPAGIYFLKIKDREAGKIRLIKR